MKNKFLDYLSTLQIQERTYFNYANVICGMLDYAEKTGLNPLSDCIQLAKSFLKSKENLNSTTINNLYKPIIMNVYTKFVRDVYKHELIITRSQLKMARGTAKKSNKAIHEFEEAKYILEKLRKIKDDEKKPIKRLNYCTLIFAIRMCYSTALRISDVLNLRLCDVFYVDDKDKNEIMKNEIVKDYTTIVQQKTKKEIEVPLNSVKNDLYELLKLHKEIYCEYNFDIHRNIRLLQVHKKVNGAKGLKSHENVLQYSHFKAMAERLLPSEDRVFSNFHGYRRGFATSTLKQFMKEGKKHECMDILQNALSHSSLTRTQAYLSDTLKEQDKKNINEKRIEWQENSEI